MVETIYVDPLDTDFPEPKKLWGALYYIKMEDQEKVQTFIYEERLTIADVTVTRPDRSESLVCMTMDVGMLPHAFPASMYADFPRNICVKDYLDRLAQIGVPQDYINWLGTLPANKEDDPRPQYIAAPSFEAPSLEGCPPPPDSICGAVPAIQEYVLPENKMCVFVSGNLMIEDSMKSLIPSATLIGAAMLSDEYLAIGCPTQPDKFFTYKNFENFWGVAYTINKEDLNEFIKAGKELYPFMADVKTLINESKEALCKTFDVGVLPSGLPFQVFKSSRLDINFYSARLREVGVPTGYVDAVVNLSESAVKDPLQDENVKKS